mgnify:FL=1
MWSGASQLDAILRCRRRDGVADAARNECDARQFSPEKTAALLRFADLPGQQPAEVDLGVTAADAFGDPGFERGLAGLDPVEKFAVGKPDFTGELPDRKPRGAQHEAQTLFVAAKVIGAGTAGMGERIHDTAFFTARPKNERGLLLHYPIGGSGKPEKR